MTFVPEAALSRIARLLRYAVSGGASALTHFGIGLALAEGLHVHPVAASTAGFVASILVSYVLQHAWVFRSATGHAVAGTRFLAVTVAAFALNTVVLWAGTEVLHAPYPIVQAVALVAIPVLNYTLNSRWTFRAERDRRVRGRDGSQVASVGEDLADRVR